jgi:peptidyl-prolyl cis-trans isomerase D
VFNFAAPGTFGATDPSTGSAHAYNTSEHRFMLDILRANTKSVFTWLIVVGIVVVFAINFGPGSLSKGGCSGATGAFAARVNGHTIPASEWEQQYRQLYQLYRQQAGEAFTRELADQLGLPAQAMEQVVDRELVIQEAKRRGLTVTRDELTRAVHAMPSFQENGVFSFALYEESARAMFGSPAKFEASLKDNLLFQKMMSAVRETVKVSDAELRAAFDAEADRVSLQFLRIPLTAVERLVQVRPDEVKAFAAKEGARIEKFHQENPARFDSKKKVRVRHVLARVAPGGDDAAARKKIEDAQARVKKGEDFAKVAAGLSDDEATRARGGDLGFVSEGLFDDAFAAAALALEAGQVSAPVRSQSGWHLLRAEEVVPAKKVSLEEARETIARELLVGERAKALARERAQAALAQAKGGRLAPVKVGAETLAPDETGAFGRATAFVPKLGEAPELLKDAFAAKAGEALPRVYETAAGPVVAVVTKRETPDPKAFETQREALLTRLQNRKESQVEGAWLRSLRTGAKIETNELLVASASRQQ